MCLAACTSVAPETPDPQAIEWEQPAPDVDAATMSPVELDAPRPVVEGELVIDVDVDEFDVGDFDGGSFDTTDFTEQSPSTHYLLLDEHTVFAPWERIDPAIDGADFGLDASLGPASDSCDRNWNLGELDGVGTPSASWQHANRSLHQAITFAADAEHASGMFDAFADLPQRCAASIDGTTIEWVVMPLEVPAYFDDLQTGGYLGAQVTSMQAVRPDTGTTVWIVVAQRGNLLIQLRLDQHVNRPAEQLDPYSVDEFTDLAFVAIDYLSLAWYEPEIMEDEWAYEEEDEWVFEEDEAMEPEPPIATTDDAPSFAETGKLEDLLLRTNELPDGWSAGVPGAHDPQPMTEFDDDPCGANPAFRNLVDTHIAEVSLFAEAVNLDEKWQRIGVTRDTRLADDTIDALDALDGCTSSSDTSVLTYRTVRLPLAGADAAVELSYDFYFGSDATGRPDFSVALHVATVDNIVTTVLFFNGDDADDRLIQLAVDKINRDVPG